MQSSNARWSVTSWVRSCKSFITAYCRTPKPPGPPAPVARRGLTRFVGRNALAHERLRLDKRPHTLLEKEGIGFCPGDQNLLESIEGRIRAK